MTSITADERTRFSLSSEGENEALRYARIDSPLLVCDSR
jgi:hypothetical protein